MKRLQRIVLSVCALAVLSTSCGVEEKIAEYETEQEIKEIERQKKLDEARANDETTEFPGIAGGLSEEDAEDTGVVVQVNVEVVVNQGTATEKTCTKLCPGMTMDQVLDYIGYEPYQIDTRLDLWFYDGELCSQGRYTCSLVFTNKRLTRIYDFSTMYIDVTSW